MICAIPRPFDPEPELVIVWSGALERHGQAPSLSGVPHEERRPAPEIPDGRCRPVFDRPRRRWQGPKP
jgi:hypothetical protein